MTVAANSKVTLAGSGVLLHVQNPSGENIPVQGTVDGAINTAGGGGGGGVVDQGAAGRLRTLYARYTGATGSSLFLQLHNAATATAPADALILYTWRIDTTFSVIEFAPWFDVGCSAGIKLAFSTTATTYTAATAETASVAVWGA